MKQLSLTTLFIIAILLSPSCAKLEKYSDSPENQILKKESSVIPVKEALARLQEFYGKGDVKSSSTSKIIKDIFVVYDSSPETKSLSTDTLLYVVNYIDESGYVILPADENIPEDVLLISETGNVSPSSFYTNTALLIDSVLKYSNPKNDNCIIGGEPDEAESFILQQVAHYASVTMRENNGAYSDTDDNVSIHGDRDTWNIPINQRTWKDTMVNVLMSTQWHQRSPYNDNVPSGRYAGCVPIAIAQIMAYNEYPENLSINDTPIVWSRMTETKNIEEGSVSAQMAAHLIRYIQRSCDSWIFKQGTFTFPQKAEKFLKDMGYKNVTRSTSYSEDVVLASLANKYPVFLAGAQNHNVFKSHGWVVDGWFRYMRYYDLQDKKSGKIVASHTDVTHYLHCNWGNNNTGWVVSGVFNSGSSTYNTWYRMITYTL
ncbi:MAG: C10 family peptidase [Bacteroidetes bacterium]|uniref:C10 family peptidase n=1 Tax=Candidatus Cryptobacteroides avicola TaxID=2840757 RepID=A0A940DUL9_9BACT|nr:C10 family peptidase [Candidatus Cryptobacteroides avicola]